MNDEQKEATYAQVPLEVFQTFSEEFDQLTGMRHEMGAQQYGDVAFLKNDMTRFIAEELADIANYARYMYMKLRFWEEFFTNAGSLDLADLAARAADGHTVSSDFASTADATGVSPVLPDGGTGLQDP